ncbi:replicative DNA helicase [Ligilactobacillus agilis]|uniref:Replicative DNA helicase n=2 Tax=Ligilactobacillus agilis TaxID=1601 RepID=A0A6F9XUR1_9LACO|nr:DnaB-like helicase C-terminal domain-containing protein [Ligilactobacillus agilis]GET08918.1 replicative DNA helicase [Ligilactobacillus agilis]
MISEVEERIIANILHKPMLLDSVDLLPSNFTSPFCKQVIEIALKLPTGERSLISIANENSVKLSEYEFATFYSKLNSLYARTISESTFLNDIELLKQHRIKEKLLGNLATYHQYQTSANLDNLLTSIQNYQSFNDSDSGELTETITQITQNVEEGATAGIKTNPKIEQRFKHFLVGSKLICIGARPGVGKTAFCLNLICSTLIHDPNVHIDFFSLEMNKNEILTRLMVMLSQVNSNVLTSGKALEDENISKRISQATDILKQSQLRVYDSVTSLEGILAKIRKNAKLCAKNKYLAFVDYIGLVSVSSKRSLERYLQLGKITRELKICTNSLNIPIIVTSQLNRGIEFRQEKEPQLSDLRESGSIEQDCNAVAFLYRDSNNPNLVNFAVKKNREGPLGRISFNFTGDTLTFV